MAFGNCGPLIPLLASYLSRFLNANGFDILRIKTWGGIGVGITAGWIKKPADVLAKKLGVGDVMVILAKRASKNQA